MPLPGGVLLALVPLSADGHHPVIALTLLARIIVVVVLHINLVVNIVHVLLL